MKIVPEAGQLETDLESSLEELLESRVGNFGTFCLYLQQKDFSEAWNKEIIKIKIIIKVIIEKLTWQFGVSHFGEILAHIDVDGGARVDGTDFNFKVRG